MAGSFFITPVFLLSRSNHRGCTLKAHNPRILVVLVVYSLYADNTRKELIVENSNYGVAVLALIVSREKVDQCIRPR